MTDQEIAALMAKAQDCDPSAATLRELEQALRQVMASRPRAPIAGQLWQTLVDLSSQAGRREDYLKNLKGRARWTEDARGASYMDILKAWHELGDAADEDFDFATATEAWERIAETEWPANAPPAAQRLLADALRHLGARRLTADPQTARAIFARELRLREAFDGAEHPNMATSLDNLATASEALGDIESAVAFRTRQLSIVEATFGPDHTTSNAVRNKLNALRKL